MFFLPLVTIYFWREPKAGLFFGLNLEKRRARCRVVRTITAFKKKERSKRLQGRMA